MKPVAIQLGPYRFAPALWPSLVFALLFPLLLGLGLWQMERAGEKQALIERHAAGALATPLAVSGDPRLTAADRYRPATVRGRFVADQQWLLDNRVYHGQPGYHVFTPFRIDGGGGASILVNRGWVAVGASREFLPMLPVPDQGLSLSGHLDRPASVGLVIGEVPLASIADRVVVQSLDIPALAAARGLDLQPLALVLDPDQPGVLTHDWSPVPPMGPEKHLGYAVQWFGLAVALLIIYLGVNLRRAAGHG